MMTRCSLNSMTLMVKSPPKTLFPSQKPTIDPGTPKCVKKTNVRKTKQLHSRSEKSHTEENTAQSNNGKSTSWSTSSKRMAESNGTNRSWKTCNPSSDCQSQPSTNGTGTAETNSSNDTEKKKKASSRQLKFSKLSKRLNELFSSLNSVVDIY